MIRVPRLSRKHIALAIAVFTFVLSIASHSFVDSLASAKQTDWIARSNENTNLLVNAESGSACTDQPRLSETLFEIDPKFRQCYLQQINNAIKTLEEKRKKEQDNSAKLDLEILIHAANQEIQAAEVDQKYRVPYVNLGKAIAESLKDSDRSDSLKQLKRYTGAEPGSTAIATLTIQQIRDRLAQPNQFFPERSQIETDLASTTLQLQNIKKQFEQKRVTGYQDAYEKLKTQLSEYTTFVRQEVLPKARTDFRLPPELYAVRLAERGVEIPAEQIAPQARTAFQDVQQKMEALAPQVAKQKGFQAKGYREVIRELKREQLPKDQILKHYEQRQKQIETIIRREKLVTLPKRSLQIRLTNDRENKSFPVPQYYPPRSSDKSASGTFIIPVLKNLPKDSQPYDDFTYPAVSWTLTAHEGRPGHDLQFTTIQDQGISEARSRFGRNSANHEGWALYAEAITLPFMSIEGQFISYQFQLLRAARAFLEPELHLGRITTDEALRVLTEDAGYSKFFAQQEIRRYTTMLPGQAPSYFYGFERLMQLRQEVEQQQGQKFNQQQFHDYILSQGFMPQTMLREAVLKQFINMKTNG